MGREIERKFLINQELWVPDRATGVAYLQGYLCMDPTVRVRLAGDKAFLTIKGPSEGIERLEMEYSIPPDDARILLDELCVRPLIEKIRYHEHFGGRLWEIDVFGAASSGLIVAEVELPSTDAHVELPPWVTREVSDDPRYTNASLVRHPYSEWRSKA